VVSLNYGVHGFYNSKNFIRYIELVFVLNEVKYCNDALKIWMFAICNCIPLSLLRIDPNSMQKSSHVPFHNHLAGMGSTVQLSEDLSM